MINILKRILSNVLNVVLFLSLIAMALLFIISKASGGSPEIMGVQIKTVLSGSMEPTFKTGSIIAIKPVEDTTTLLENDVITFLREDSSIVTHRVIQVIKSGDNTMYQTKGDNNEAIDGQYVLAGNVIGKYTGFTIPFLGYFIEFTRSNKGTAILLIIPGIILLIYSAMNIMSIVRLLDPKKDNNQEVESVVGNMTESG